MKETRITVAHSPDSDDAFMFYGLASGDVDTGGIVVDQVLADIETLNRAAFEGKYEVTAVSFHAYAHLADKYALLPHGASMGDKLRPDRRRAPGRSDGRSKGSAHRDPRHADDGVPGAADLRTGLRVRRRAVRRDPAGRPRRQGRGRPADPRRAADVRRTRACARSSISASGGPSAPAGCRCRSAATSSGAISVRR